ncbi:MAG TPA: class I SAM-dependent methyltransferase [Vicinamibacterales bacterium]|nr:class I SAM-dependent methyltransferase [Vicinamibacterales bacterium]
MATRAVHDFWNHESCGEVYARGGSVREQLAAQARTRYELEPYLAPFARFTEARGAAVLEIGVGMGADHLQFAEQHPRRLVGLDLTTRALAHTRNRLVLEGHAPRLLQADAERLPFPDASFDLVFSWGVLHHTADVAGAIREVHRVLVPGGRARVMLYHRNSWTVDMLWLRYAVAAGRPWRSRRAVVGERLESPGTQAFTRAEAERLFAPFAHAAVRPQLAFTDLLEGAAGQRHRGPVLAAARRIWPRRWIRRGGARRGFNLLIEARK